MAYGKAYKKYAKGTFKKNAGIKKTFRKNARGTSFKTGAARSMLRPVNSPQQWAAAMAKGNGRPFEIKALDIKMLDYPIMADTTNTYVYLLNGVIEGAGFFNRIGRHINMRSLHMRGTLAKIPVVYNTLEDFCRIAIVYDRQPSNQAALPQYTDIFKDYTSGGVADSTVFSGVNLDNRERFIILRDWNSMLPAVTDANSAHGANMEIPDNTQNAIDEFIKLKGLSTHFNGTTSAVPPDPVPPLTVNYITTGSLLLVVQGTKVAGSWKATLKFRLRYDDA